MAMMIIVIVSWISKGTEQIQEHRTIVQTILVTTSSTDRMKRMKRFLPANHPIIHYLHFYVNNAVIDITNIDSSL